MSKPIENCPVEEKPIRERAWTAEQAEQKATFAEKVSFPEMAAMLRAYAATLRQQTTNSPGISSKLVDDGAVSDEVVERACLAYIAADLHLLAGAVDLMREPMRAALEAVAPLLRAPGEGHEVKVLSHDGECWTSAKWEHQEGAYVTHDAIRLRDAPAEQGGRVDGFEDWWERTESDVSSPHDAAKSAWQAALAQNAHREVVACWRIYGGRWTSGEPPVDAVKDAERTGEKIELAYFHAERARVPAVTFDMVKEAEFFCPTDLPTLERLRWKAKRLTELLSATPSQPEDAA